MEKKIRAIIHIIKKHLSPLADKYSECDKKSMLYKKIRHFVAGHKKILLVTTGFSCKSPDKKHRVFSHLPDMGEILTIEHLDSMCDKISAIYPQGCELTILTDSAVYSDLINVAENEKNAYQQSLRELTITQHIQWKDLSTFYSEQDISYPLIVTGDSALSAQPASFEQFIRAADKPGACIGLFTYLYNAVGLRGIEVAHCTKRLHAVRYKTYQLMCRLKQCEALISTRYPDHIRLSIQAHDKTDTSLPVSPVAGLQTTALPWNSVPLRLIDGRFTLVALEKIDQYKTALVTCQNKNWFFMEVENQALTTLRYEIKKSPRFGMVISDTGNNGYHCFSESFLSQLSEDFGFIVLKGIELEQEGDFIDFSKSLGDLYVRDFSIVDAVKPDKQNHKPVNAQKKVSLHWDLSMLPPSNKYVRNNALFSAKNVMLYCKSAPQRGEGQIILSDSRSVLKMAGSKKVQQWKQISVTSYTRRNYFGGFDRTYPLVIKHPKNNDYILRYQERSNLTLQEYKTSAEKTDNTDINAIMAGVNHIAYDERCMVTYEWSDNDLVIIDNHYTLHGRLPMTEKSRSRELWRIRIV